MISARMAGGLVAFLALAAVACSGEPLRKITEECETCEARCALTYPLHTYPKPNHLEACKKGCRFFAVAGFRSETHDMNATHSACVNACTETYPSEPSYYACTGGCDEQLSHVRKLAEEHKKSHLHPLKLLMLVQQMYETVVDHVCRLIRRTFYAVYLQQDTGNLVVVRGELKPIRILDPHAGEPSSEQPAKPSSSAVSGHHQQHEEASTVVSSAPSSSWLDCISRQSGIPEWLLMMVLFLVVVTMVWLCCATMVTSPSGAAAAAAASPPPAYSHHKMGVSGDLDYLLIYDPSEQVKVQPPVDQEAPPLPVKVPLSQI